MLAIQPSYVYDTFSLFNVLTGDPFYTQYHEAEWERFGAQLTPEAAARVKQMVELNGRTMLGPAFSVWHSAVPDAELLEPRQTFADRTAFRKAYERFPYSQGVGDWDAIYHLLEHGIALIDALERMGWRDYWHETQLPLIAARAAELRATIDIQTIYADIALMRGTRTLGTISCYLGNMLAPHGIKLCGDVLVTDATYAEDIVIHNIVHEMFHPPYDEHLVEAELDGLAADSLVTACFDAQTPSMRYEPMRGFLEENIVEAIALTICKKHGVKKNIAERLDILNDGVQKLTLILVDAMLQDPMKQGETFEAYFKRIYKRLPVGHLEPLYHQVRSLG